MTRSQTSTDPADAGHLYVGDRITLEELATHLSAAAVWLHQLAVAAERPAVPVELEQICDELARTAAQLTRTAETVAEVDGIVTDERPLARGFGSEPWGFAAHGADPDRKQYGKRLSTVLTPHQICSLARLDTPWRADQAEPGVAYLDGLDGLPGLERWESQRGAKRRAAEREARIRTQTRQEPCTSCGAEPGRACQTRTGRLAEIDHQPRRQAAVATVDAAELAVATS
jgi:hypothetical protein